MSAPPLTLTVAEAAKRIGVSRWTLYRQIHEGRFPPAIRIGQTWRISVAALERFLLVDPR